MLEYTVAEVRVFAVAAVAGMSATDKATPLMLIVVRLVAQCLS